MRRSFIKKFATSIKAIRGKSSNITYDTIKFAIARLIGRRSAPDYDLSINLSFRAALVATDVTHPAMDGIPSELDRM